MQQVGGYRRVTGRSAGVFSTAALDPTNRLFRPCRKVEAASLGGLYCFKPAACSTIENAPEIPRMWIPEHRNRHADGAHCVPPLGRKTWRVYQGIDVMLTGFSEPSKS